MKLKFVAFGLALAVASSAFAQTSGMPTLRRKKQPTVPTIPVIPKFPTDPTKPDWPNIPLPGDPKNPKGEPGVPFPMSTTLPFPWGNIEGIWKVELDSAQLIFSFTIEMDSERHQFLRALQLDNSNGQVLAQGFGLRVEGDKVVRVAMLSKVDKRESYMLFIGSYKNDGKTSDKIIGRTDEAAKSVTVLTVRSFADLMGSKDVQVVITKISNTPYPAQKYLPNPARSY